MAQKKVKKFDTRWVFVAIIIAVCIPILSPLGLPINISDNTRLVYETINSLEPGSIVFMTPDTGYQKRGELIAMMETIYHMLAHMDVKVITIATFSSASPLLMEEVMLSVGLEEHDKVYGEDFVNLGYLTGSETTIAAIGNDLKAVVKVDLYLTPIDQLPILESVDSAKDIDLLISIAGGMDYPELYLRQWQTTHGVKITGGCVGDIVATLQPYIATGQLTGFLPSLKGAAEFELLTNRPGQAIVGMDSQSLMHVVVIAFILISNLEGFFGRPKTS